MARSVNKVILLGNVGNQPEIRSVGNGGRVANISLATSRQWNDAQGNKQEKTEWHRLVIWNRGAKGGLADVVEKYVKKGDKLYIEGEISYRQWQDKDGQTRYTTEITVNELTLLGNNSGGGEGRSASAPRQQAAARAPQAAAASNDFPDYPGAGSQPDDEDDDLPF